MFLSIIPLILGINLVSYASQGHLFKISVRTGFRSIYLHKMIAEREVLSLGRECSIQEFPQAVEEWGCDSDEKGVICKKSYTCLPDGGKKKRYAHIKNIERLLAREIKETGKYVKLEQVGYSSKNGSYFLKTDYTPPAKNAAVALSQKRTIIKEPVLPTSSKKSLTKPKDSSKSLAQASSEAPSEIPTEYVNAPQDIPPERPISSDPINAEAYVAYSQDTSPQSYSREKGGRFMPGEGRGLEFDLSLGWIKDNNKGSLRTTHVAWTPKYKLDAAFMIGLDLGAQVLESPLTSKNYFIAVDSMLSGHFFLSNRTYLKVSGGIQRWSGELKDTHSIWGAGMGAELSNKTISRLFIQYMRVGNLTKNQEYRIGLGISF
ncbi:MAG: hypothetical protein OXB84_04520 [Halobacteriovoraceae bacterium]|nr:hypothetical protein [Halobacteriovoraceae bacterium]